MEGLSLFINWRKFFLINGMYFVAGTASLQRRNLLENEKGAQSWPAPDLIKTFGGQLSTINKVCLVPVLALQALQNNCFSHLA